MRFAVILSVFLTVLVTACETSNPNNTSSNVSSKADQNGIRVSSEGKFASESGIAASADGRIFVVWSERDENKKNDIYVREYDTALGPRGDAVRVNPEAGTARTWYGDTPSILVAPDGKIHVGWNRTYADGSPGNDLVLSTSNDGGKTFGEPLKINDDTVPASHGMHGMTIDSKGRVLISWLDERYLRKNRAHNSTVGGPFVAMLFQHPRTPAAEQSESEEPDAELYFAVVAEGKLTGPNQKIAGEVCPCCRVSVASTPYGAVYIAYRKVFPGQFRHIAISTSADGGETFTEPVQVSDDKWKLFACPVAGAALKPMPDGLRIAWYSGGERSEKGLYHASSTDKGKTFSAPELISKAPVKGSPQFVGEGLVFGDPEKMYLVSGASERSLGTGIVPSAVEVGGKVVCVFAQPTEGTSSIRLSHITP